MSILPVVVSDFISFIKSPSYQKSETPFWKLYLLDPLSTFLIAALIIYPLEILTDVFESSENILEEAIEIIPFWLMIILVTIIIPLIEEIIFRSWLNRRLVSQKYLKFALIFSSVVFGLVHLTNYEEFEYANIILIIPQTTSGFILGYIRIVKGLRYSWLTHGLTNGLIYLTALIFPNL